MKIQKVALFISFTLVVGCRPAGMLTLPTPQGGPSQGAVVQQDAQARKGSLSIAVKWPERSLPGFNAQVIPKTTKALVLEIKDAEDSRVYYELIKRPEQGTDPARREIFLNEGAGYKVTVEAFENFGTDLHTGEEGPTGTAIASVTKTGIEIQWNKKTAVPLPLDAKYAPAVSSLFLDADVQRSTDHAGAGATLFLTGQNLTWNSGEGAGLPEVVFPSGAVATAMTEGAGNVLRFTVPANAGSGNLRLRVNGVSSAPSHFQEVKSINFTAGKAQEFVQLDDFMGDGVVRSWLGESFPFVPFGNDSSDSYMVTVNSQWESSAPFVGTVNPQTGAYQSNTAQTFGETIVSASSGNVKSSHKVIVGAPAGPFIALADPGRAQGAPASDPAGGLSVAKLDAGRYVGAWFDRTDNRVHWQFFNQNGVIVYNQNGVIVDTHHATPAVFRDGVRMVRVAVQGGKVMIAYTLENGFGLSTIDPQTGAIRQTKTYDSEAESHFYRLANLGATNNTFMAAFYGMISGKLHMGYKIFTVDENGAITETYHRIQQLMDGSLNVLPVNNNDKDTIEIMVKDGNYLLAYHFVGAANDVFDRVHEINDAGATVRQGGGFPRSNHRVIAAAHNATHILTVAVDENNKKVKAYLYGKDDPFNSVTAKMIDVATIGDGIPANPLDNPTSVVWNGTEFLVTYNTNIVVDSVTKARPVVQAINPDGTLKGAAQPVANLGASPMLVPTDEGAMAFWLSGNKKLIARRLKFR